MGLAENLAAVERRVADACARAGRERSSVRLLPVTKTMSTDVIRQAYRLGVRRFGENTVQEAWHKAQELAGELPGLEWAIIGHLQTNKAGRVAQFAAEFEALDSARVAAELDRRLQAAGRQLDVLVQVNSSSEPGKFGAAPDAVVELARTLAACDALRVRGLMTLAVFSDDAARVQACFERTVHVQRHLQDVCPDVSDWRELSMGMSGDFELAIEHGATIVRVGQAIFGARLAPSDYWPSDSSGTASAGENPSTCP